MVNICGNLDIHGCPLVIWISIGFLEIDWISGYPLEIWKSIGNLEIQRKSGNAIPYCRKLKYCRFLSDISVYNLTLSKLQNTIVEKFQK